jgi:hypothetical protein
MSDHYPKADDVKAGVPFGTFSGKLENKFGDDDCYVTADGCELRFENPGGAGIGVVPFELPIMMPDGQLDWNLHGEML